MRTKLRDRSLPAYSRAEEKFNMVSHIIGGAIGVGAVIACVVAAAIRENVWGIVSGSIYGGTIIIMYTMSSLYHGLKPETAKKVFRILDHCSIFILIAGTYTPILLGRFRELFPIDAWVIFAVLWGTAAIGISCNSIDLKKFNKASFVCYLLMGWCMVFRLPNFLAAYPIELYIFILAGGASYTIGAVFYMFGQKKKFIHSVFHLFAVTATLLHLVGIVIYVM